jgi:predicted Zn-dependent peptidase
MKVRLLHIFILLCLLGCSSAGETHGPRPPTSFMAMPQVVEHTLDNGMQLFILPRPGVPIVSFVVQYRIGGVNEAPGNTGIAHLLEHLLFKGTTTIGTKDFTAEGPLLEKMDETFDSLLVLERSSRPDHEALQSLEARIDSLEARASELTISNEFDQILSENGARGLNATTTSETTSYFVELPSNRAELWFAIEADRMRNPVFREFFTERDVVAEERRLRLDDSPGALLYAAHLGAAFQRHPYGIPVVGLMEDVQRLSRRDVEEYFRRFYGPNNAVVAIAGDVDPDQILAWARQYLGPIPRGETPEPVRIVEPEQTEERRVEVVYDAEPSLRVGWKVPASLSEDAPALNMLTSVLTGGRSSRLYRRLVLQDGLAASVTSSSEPGQLYPSLFSINASPLHPHTVGELEEAIYEELEKLKEAPPEERELQRVRNQLEASQIRRLRSSFGLAFQVASSATLYNDWRATFTYTGKLLEVTPEDIQDVVTKYFRKELRTVATLVKPGSSGGEQ